MFRRASTWARSDSEDDVMTSTLSGLLTSLIGLLVFVAVVAVALRVAQSVFGTDTKKAAATEVAAKLVSYPTGSAGVLRRRFVRALTGQHVIMPSGERLAFSELTVRLAPEDVDRLDPDGDLDRLGADGATVYLAHSRREGWAVPDEVTVTVQVDPGLRAGWVPPARGTRSARASDRPPRGFGWDVMVGPGPDPDVAAARPRPRPADHTARFPADSTVAVAGVLRLRRGDDVVSVPAGVDAVLGRHAASPLVLDDPEVSYRHAAVRLRSGDWQVKDLGSTNGTTVDGERVGDGQWTTLRDGAELRLAGVRVTATTTPSSDAQGTVHVEGLTTRR
ncbi:FHA domain protein [Aeromicrobium marinum DSM 15272]|uniref:FHA domain protein n=2 Tax=Aeromicrobium marinum TaxID=219314 RepID=E2SAH8_9ACTN|nr:FHA domain protein [Aeromicrobium marinum DSM 15272]